MIEKFVGLDMSDADTVFDRCLDACHRIRKVGPRRRWGCDPCVAAVACSASRLGPRSSLISEAQRAPWPLLAPLRSVRPGPHQQALLHPHPPPPPTPTHPPQEMGDLDGVTCFCELAVPLASRLCERLGLATNSPQVGGDCTRDWPAS